MSKLQINTRVRRLIHYIEDIEKGLIQIPAFQRDFVWTTSEKLELFDSLKNGYPIGSILFWQPKKSFGENEYIGPYKIPDTTDGQYFYILDGFQRLSTIFGCLTNPHKTNLDIDSNLLDKEYSFHYDLVKEEFAKTRGDLETHQVPLYIFADTLEFLKFSQQWSKREDTNLLVERATTMATTLLDYQLPSIDIIGGDISEAVEIFSRVNSKGLPISPDWMISALTYNQDKDFRLASLIDEITERLSIYNYHRIKRDLIFQCIVHSFGKAHFDQSSRIEQLAQRDDFIPTTQKTIENIEKATKFLFEEIGVVDIRLLPYNNQLVFITDFFNQITTPNNEQLEQLKKWFWVTTYSSYFTIYSLSKQREAYNQFQAFLSEETINPIYNDKPDTPFSVIDFPTKIFYGSVRAKALVLFLINMANGFEKLNALTIDGLFESYLFAKVKNEHNNKFPAGIITYAEPLEPLYPKKRDMSFLLEDYKADYRHKYFLTREMSKLYLQDKNNRKNKIKIIEMRESLIKEAEKAFVEGLGLSYDS